MKKNHPRLLRGSAPATLLGLTCLLAGGLGAQAASFGKADNTTPLNQAGSWTNNAVPTSVDTAVWDATVATAANATNVLGASMTWSNLIIANPAATVQISADGNILSLTNLTLSGKDLVLNCGLNLYGNPTWNLGGHQLTLGSAMGGTGNLKQQSGKLVLAPGAGALPSGMTYSWSGTGTLDLGGNSQALLNLGTPWGATGFVTNGNLSLSLASGDFNPNPQGNNSIQDLSGLTAFTVSNRARNFTFNVGGTTAGTFNIYLYLAATGAGTNFLAVNSLNPGSGSGISSGSSPMTYMFLGKANTINANTLQVAGYKGSGALAFKGGLSNPQVTLRGTNGVDALPNWIVGTLSTGAYAEVGTNDFTGGTIDCVASNLVVGQHISGANNSIIGSLTLDGTSSQVVVTNAVLAQKTGAGAPPVLGTINQNNGTVRISTLTLGDNQGTASGVKIQAGYNLNNGTLRAQTIQSGLVGLGEASGSYRTIFWTNGVIANYDAATDLTMFSGVLSAQGPGARYFTPDAGRTVSIQGQINQGSASATPLVMNGAGTLDLAGAVDNSWASLNVSNGVVLLDKTSSPSVHALGMDFAINGGTVKLAGSGGDQIYDQRVAYLTNGTFDLNAQSETMGGLAGPGGVVTDSSGAAGNLTLNVTSATNFAFGGNLSGSWNLTKNGLGKQTFYGTDLRTSAFDTINAGTLEIGNGNGSGTLASSVTVNQNATLAFNRAGTFTYNGNLSGQGNLAQNGPGTLVLGGSDTHSGSTLVNNGTLAVAASATSLAGSTLTVQAGATLNLSPASGNLALGFNQVLNGQGNVNGSFLLGSGSTLASNLTINGSVTAVDGSTNNPGAYFAAGTLTINGSFTNSGYNYWVYNLANVTTVGGGINPLLEVSGNLDLGNPNNNSFPVLLLHGTPVSGRYTLATFGSFSGDVTKLQVSGSSRYTYTPRLVGNALVLDITGNGGNLVWQGDGLNNFWNTDPGNLDWFNLATSAADAFNPNDNVTFNDTSANTNVNVAASVLPASVTVNATTNYYFNGVGGSIDGPTGLTKTNSGTLVLLDGLNNGFTGPINLNGGTISVSTLALNGTPSPLGAGTTLAFDGGTLQYTGPAVGAAGFNRQISLGADGGTIDQESTSGVYLFLTNLISGTGSLVKTGAQQLIIGEVTTGTGSNSYLGITYVQAGQLQLRNTNALGSAAGKTVVTDPGNVAAGGSLQGTILEPFDLSGYGGGNGALQAQDNNTAVTFAGPINLVTNAGIGGITASAILNVAGPVTGAGSLTKAGANTVVFLATPSYSGGTIISNGVLQLGTNSTTGWLPAQPAGVALTNYGVLAFNRADTNTYAGAITGTGALRQNGSGTTILAASNDFTGNININAGALRGAANSALGLGGVYLPGGNTFATLELAGNATLSNSVIQLPMHNAHSPAHIRNVSGTNTLAGPISLASGGANWDINSDSGKLILAGPLSPTAAYGDIWRTLYLGGSAYGELTGIYDEGLMSGVGKLNLDIAGGTWTLSSSNNYSGNTTVEAGATLLVNATQSTGTGNVAVNGTLGGTGTIAGPTTIAASGTLAPGAGIGTLSFATNLTIAGNLLFEVNKAASPANDFVIVGGGLTNTGTGTLTVTNLGAALVAGDRFVLFNQPMTNGNALTVVTPGVTWTNLLAIDGSIQVLSVGAAVATNPTNLTWGLTAGGTALNISWPTDHTGWTLQVQTNALNVGLANAWYPWAGSISTNFISMPVVPGNPTVFFRLVYTKP